jgi:hypothetical protein
LEGGVVVVIVVEVVIYDDGAVIWIVIWAGGSYGHSEGVMVVIVEA